MQIDTLERAQDLCAFVSASPSPFHAVAESIRRLEAAGFQRLDERQSWELKPGDAAYVMRSDASLIAVRVGSEPASHSGFHIVGAHTDSPNLRLKPRPVYEKEGYAQLGVEIYGGVLLHTWVDRDLGIAGRLIVEDGEGQLRPLLVRMHAPLARVSSLAIHLDREVNDRGVVYNRQAHMAPLLGFGPADKVRERLFTDLAGQHGFSPTDIRGFDLGLYDLTAPTIGGAEGEFVFSARLDNLASCHAAVSALVEAPLVARSTRVIALFDHEEIGSASAQGAHGSFLKDVLWRLLEATHVSTAGGISQAIASSFCISADMAHAVHPNYADRHEPLHMPRLGQGPVLKSNVQMRYATDGMSAARFRTLCRRLEIPVQDFVTRTDLACGSTIGPITASELGIPTVDVGNPMLSMHSTRELCGTRDVALMLRALRGFFSA